MTASLLLCLLSAQQYQVSFLGDSTAQLPARWLVGSGRYQVINHAQSGATVTGVYAVWKATTKDAAHTGTIGALPWGYDGVILLAGFNDLKQSGTPTTAYTAMSSIISEADTENKTIVVVKALPAFAMKIYAQPPQYPYAACLLRQADIDAYNALLAADSRVDCLVDAEDIFWDRATGTFHVENYFSYPNEGMENIDIDCNGVRDGAVQRLVHPNQQGAQLLAQRIADQCGSALEP